MITWIGANNNNFEKGRRGRKPELIVVHWIVGPLVAADAVFNNPQKLVSSHYGIGGNEIHQYVKEKDTAYHAGVYDINLRSIGVEHEGGPNLPISDATYITSARLIADIARRYNIPLDREHIKGHKEFKATQCPGILDIDKIIKEAKKNDPLQECLIQHAELVAKLNAIDGFRKAIAKALINSEEAEWQRILDEVNLTIKEKDENLEQASLGDRLWDALQRETGLEVVKYTLEGEEILLKELQQLKFIVPEGYKKIKIEEYEKLKGKISLDKFTISELLRELLNRFLRRR